MKRKNLILAAIFIFVSGLISGCSSTPTNPTSTETKYVAPTKISLKASGYQEGKEFKIIRDETITIQASVLPKEATNRTVSWKSDNPDIQVTDLGNNKATVKGWEVTTGNIIISVVNDNFSMTLPVTCVTEIMPASIRIPGEQVELKQNTRQQYDVKVLPEDATVRDYNVTISPVTTLKPGNDNGISAIKDDENFYLKEEEADIGDIYKVEVISARDNTIKNSFKVKIVPYLLEEISFKNEDITLSLKDPTYRMCPKFYPEKTSYLHATYESLNPDICDIETESGKLLPKKVGVATIKVTSVEQPEISNTTTVTINDNETEYLFRNFKSSYLDNLEAYVKDWQDMEFDKVSFAKWQNIQSEDTWYSHALDGGWSMWLCGQDYWDDNNCPDDDRANVMVYNKVHVPLEATKVQFVFRSHLHANDTSLLRMLMIDENKVVTDLTNGWLKFDNTYDRFINFDMTAYQGKDVTFVIQQDMEAGTIFTKDACCNGRFLMFRRMGFDVNNNPLIEDDAYNILNWGKEGA